MAETPTTLSTCIIRPSSPTPPQHMFLPSTDSFWRWFHYNQRILFFKLPNHYNSLVAHLKSSLALALVDFFPWAGRVFEQENGRLALDCNDAGVPFIEAYIDLPFSSLEDEGFKHQPFFKNFAPHGDAIRWTGPDLPLLSVQVTRFPRDEGVVLGIGYSHIVADGSSVWHFMKSWGEYARGVPLSIYPVHMREVFSPQRLLLPPPSTEDESDKSSSPFPEGESNSNIELVQHDFEFTSEMLKKLKYIATSTYSPTDHAPFSSLQALSAHIWKHVIAATNVDKSKETIFYLLADMRSRMDPPLPVGYFGNAISGNGTKALTEELQQENLGTTALRLQKLISTLDETFMRESYGKVEVLPFSKLLEEFRKDFNMVRLHVSSSPRFPVYEVDFGMGPPSCVRCPHIRGNGEMVWFPGRDGDGSIDFSLALPKPVME
ncbi:hypothetical protein GOP47_0030924, partial [Adiantum capillus-veneris]